MDTIDAPDTEWDETSPKSKLSYYVDFYLHHGPEELKMVIDTIMKTDYGDILCHMSKKCQIPICNKCMGYDVMRYIEKFSHMQYRMGLYNQEDLKEFFEKVEFFAKRRLESAVNAPWPSDP